MDFCVGFGLDQRSLHVVGFDANGRTERERPVEMR